MKNVVDVIQHLPENIRRQVLFSLVGSLNFSAIAAAEKMVTELAPDGVKGLEPRDFEMLFGIAPDGMEPPLVQWRALEALRQELHNMLNFDPLVGSALPGREWGSFQQALDRACGAQSAPPVNKEGIKALRALGEEITDEQVAAAREKQRALRQQYADQRSAKRGALEWVHEKIVAQPVSGDPWSLLSEERREALWQKYGEALTSAKSTAISNAVAIIKPRPGSLGLGDVPVLNQLIEEFNTPKPTRRRVASK